MKLNIERFVNWIMGAYIAVVVSVVILWILAIWAIFHFVIKYW